MSRFTLARRYLRLTPIGLAVDADLAALAILIYCIPSLWGLFTLMTAPVLTMYLTAKAQIICTERALATAQRRNDELAGALQQALIDPVTALPGRRVAEDYLTLADGTGKTIAVIDVDGMHDINHDYGYAIGDGVLAGFADLLRSVAADGDHVARLGGDEFLLITDRPPADMSRCLLSATQLPADPGHPDDPVAYATIGISAIDGTAARAALARADLAMNYAKRSTHGIAVYDLARDGMPHTGARPLRRRRDRRTDPTA